MSDPGFLFSLDHAKVHRITIKYIATQVQYKVDSGYESESFPLAWKDNFCVQIDCSNEEERHLVAPEGCAQYFR